MKNPNPLRSLALYLLHSAFCLSVAAQTTAFTYQGSLSDNGSPASGIYDLRFAIYDVETSGVAISALTNAATTVSDGLFTVQLDFGNGVFDGSDRWLEIGVRTNGGGAFALLVPRQSIMPTPYTLYADAVNAAGVTGIIPASALAGTYDAAVNFANTGNSFAGNGTALTQLNATQLKSGTVNDARLSSNVALRNAPQTFTATNIFSSSLGVGGVMPTAQLDVNGQVRIRGGAPGAGKVLTSDATGTAAWSPIQASPQVVVVDAAGNGNYSTVSAALAAITPTLNSPYVIEVRPGLYFDRVAMKSHVHLKGAGAASTAIMFNPAGAVNDSDIAVIKLNALTNVAVSGLTLTTRGYTNFADLEACVGINDIGSSPVISDVIFTANIGYQPSGAFAIEVFGVASSGSIPVIRDCRFDAPSAADGISLFQSEGLISGNVFGAQYHAVFLTQSGAQILNNRMTGVAEAVYIDSASSATVAFNQFVGSGTGAKAIKNNGAARIVGNEISGAHTFGIDCEGDAAIVGNSLTGCTQTGIRVIDSARTTVTDNLLLNCSGAGERALALIDSSAVVAGNTFSASAFGDISVAGSGTPTINNNHTTGTVSGGAIVAGYGSATISTTTTSNLVLTAAGGVGIGTTSPMAQLDVRGTNSSFGATISPNATTTRNILNLQVGINTNGAANGIGFVENTSGFGMKLGYDGSGGGSENKLVIYDNLNQSRFVLENGGNLGLSTNNPAFPIHHSSGAHLTLAGVWTSVSDRNAKEDFAAIHPQEVLARVVELPISRWKYKVETDGTQHLGPMAQDFHAAFGLGTDDKSIGTVDADGVALAAIQGLNEKLEIRSQSAEVDFQELRAENAELKRSNTALEQRLAALEQILGTQNSN